MKGRKALKFLKGLRDKELCLVDLGHVRRSKLAIQKTPEGYLAEIVERGPYSLASKMLAEVESVRWASENPRTDNNLYIFKLCSVNLQGDTILVRGEARTYDTHNGTVDDGSPLDVELVLKEVTDTGGSSTFHCM